MHTYSPGRDASAPTSGAPARALPLGLNIELSAGPVTRETAREHATRLAVATAVLEELREAGEIDHVSALNAEYAAALLTAVPLRRRPHPNPTRSAA